ncbi:unnamed protein product [Miscanthus lutarioriparius]|uniref:PUM-HD domain-containing protein n=1 Tax=Miscanthus lutarioriparius TaxID=422564 RepID=A0A811R369_9POAL|nr:unnamed protein product [Miscanthus lutarioriparius]
MARELKGKDDAAKSSELHMNELKNYTYGKHIVARVEKLIVTGAALPTQFILTLALMDVILWVVHVCLNALSPVITIYGKLSTVLEVLDMDRKIDIVHELKNYVLKSIGDQNGNHVIQKCIECVPEDCIPFVIDPILSQILVLCTHQYGCRVIQRVLEHCHDPVTQSAIMNKIVQQTFHLTDDKFGNYVVQHVLEHGKPEERSSIIQKLSGQVVILSKQKFASNVIEKCLAFGTPEERDSLIGEIISSGQTFQELMKDQFGNYVVRRVLQTCDDKYLEMILSSIKLHS